MIAGHVRAKHGSLSVRQSPEKHRAYKAWCNMRRRVLDPTCDRYAIYGGRGVTICPEWIDDFPRFYADMGPMPAGYSLERKDVNGPYVASNCCYIPRGEQWRNRRTTELFEHDGRRLALTEWARELPLSLQTLRLCVHERGMTIGEVIAMGKPRRGRPRKSRT
jgi:hypothetical protein